MLLSLLPTNGSDSLAPSDRSISARLTCIISGEDNSEHDFWAEMEAREISVKEASETEETHLAANFARIPFGVQVTRA